MGTSQKFSEHPNHKEHYQNLRARYINCTYVQGNLELTWLQDENLELSFLEHIQGVSGYVLIYGVNVEKIILPSLKVIHGQTILSDFCEGCLISGENAFVVSFSKIHNLEMPALRGNINIHKCRDCTIALI